MTSPWPAFWPGALTSYSLSCTCSGITDVCFLGNYVARCAIKLSVTLFCLFSRARNYFVGKVPRQVLHSLWRHQNGSLHSQKKVLAPDLVPCYVGSLFIVNEKLFPWHVFLLFYHHSTQMAFTFLLKNVIVKMKVFYEWAYDLLLWEK